MGNKSYFRSKNNDTFIKESFLSTLRRKSTLRVRKSWVPRTHLDILKWLESLDLKQYEGHFKKFAGVEDLLYYDESKIKRLGIKVSLHRARIMASLYSLREKYEKNQKLNLDLNVRTSLVEGEDLEIAKHIQNNSEVVFRNGSSFDRRLGNKREATLLSPDTIVKMSFGVNEEKKPNMDWNEMKKLLEWELSLDASDLRSHAWYHGAIPRGRAEEIIQENSQFLIRDCISQPGDFVLSCFTNGQVLHFVIQKVIAQPNTIYERVQYQFEGDSFDSIPDLITAYVGGKKAITMSSGSKITTPVNRTAPLTFYASKYVSDLEQTKIHGTLSKISQNLDKRAPAYSGTQHLGVSCSIVKTGAFSPRLRRSSGPTGLTRVRRPSSEVNPSENVKETEPRMSTSNLKNASNFSSLPRRLNSEGLSVTSTSSIDIKPINYPPPKPSRTPSTKLPRKVVSDERTYEEIDEIDGKIESSVALSTKDSYVHSKISEVYQQSGSDSGNGSGDSIQTSCSDTKTRDSEISLGDTISTEKTFKPEIETILVEPLEDPASAYDLENFSTLLLPAIENKPLDATALRGSMNILTECGSRVLAAHLTRIDLNLLNGPIEKDFGLGVSMGIELMSLPHGSQLRRDIIERTECFKLFVSITILKQEDISVRAELIHRWIQIAIDTKTAMGNLFGFTNIMLGLCIPEIQRLSHTWHIVRQKFTDSAFNFESKLRNTTKNMNECTNPQAPNTVIPHILPFVIIWERDLDDIYAQHNQGDSLFQWESTGSDHGLQMLLSHLQEGRSFCQNLRLYKRNEQIIMGDLQTMDELTLDMFSTEFHLKFLFGSKAAYADSRDRLAMFQRVVSTLSEYCEPFSDDVV